MKLAVIIGNNDYNYLDKLCLCIRDAELVNDTLTKLGFRTRLCKNCTNEEIRDELMRFGDQLEEGDIAFFYFSGHAGQQNIANKQDNYLFGIDARPRQIGETSTISGIAVNNKILECWFREECIYLIVLDACREFPAKNLKYRAVSASQIATPQRTLAPAYLPEYIGRGQYDLVYACQPGKFAIEDEQLENGYLASGLCSSLQSEDNWNSALTEMINKVHTATKGRQNPSVVHNLRIQLKLIDHKWLEDLPATGNNRVPARDGRKERATLKYDVGDSGKCIQIVRADLTDMEIEAIVNVTDEQMSGISGLDGAVHHEAGPQLMQALMQLPEFQHNKRIKAGGAVITEGFKLPAKYIIHTAGPIFQMQPEEQALQQLRMCYTNCLNIAADKKFTKIAVPAISCGSFGAPVNKAARIGVESCLEYLKSNDNSIQEIWLVLMEFYLYDLYKEIATQIFDVLEDN